MGIVRLGKLGGASSHIGLECMVISVFLRVKDPMEGYDRANIAGAKVPPDFYMVQHARMKPV
jgi:hypothetical protein